MEIRYWLFLLILLGSIVGFLYIWFKFRRSIVLHIKAGKEFPAQFDLTATAHQIISSGGVKIASWYIPVENPRAVVILVHGYASSVGGKTTLLKRAKFLNEIGYSTLLLDLRSFGQSEGNKISLGAKEWQEVAAAYDFARSLPENKLKKIGLWGGSMGGATVIIAASLTAKADFVIAEVPFANFKSLLSQQIKREGYPSFLQPLMLPLLRLAAAFELGFNYESYSPDKLISEIKAPILIIAALNDEWVGDQAGKILFDLAKGPKHYWQADSSHDVFIDDPKGSKSKIAEFLSKYL